MEWLVKDGPLSLISRLRQYTFTIFIAEKAPINSNPLLIR